MPAADAGGPADPLLAACDNERLQTGLRAGITQRTGLTITGVSNIREVRHTQTLRICRMAVTTQEGESADFVYSLTLRGTTTDYLIIGVNDQRLPGAPTY
jgi:hypothetical protein